MILYCIYECSVLWQMHFSLKSSTETAELNHLLLYAFYQGVTNYINNNMTSINQINTIKYTYEILNF